ncbi:hypothetical protein, partial [Holdemania massiliensis]
ERGSEGLDFQSDACITFLSLEIFVWKCSEGRSRDSSINNKLVLSCMEMKNIFSLTASLFQYTVFSFRD